MNARKKLIKITVEGGVVQEVRGLPAGYQYEVIDHDVQEGRDDAPRPMTYAR